MAEDDLIRKIEELARRLERVEQTLNLTPGEAASSREAPSTTVTPVAHTPPTPAATPPVHAQTEPRETEAPAKSPLASQLAERKEEAARRAAAARQLQQERLAQQPPAAARTAQPKPPSPPTSPPAAPATRAPHTDQPPSTPHAPQQSPQRPRTAARAETQHRNGLEVFLGIKAAAAIGAVIVVLGTAFAIREYATGFWAALPTSLQALIIAGFGGALIALGEVAARRLGRAGSLGLISAGLGVLYLDAYATFQWFEPAVVSQNGSFLLMAVVALIGFALTVRTRSLFIGMLSLVLGYLTPLLLAGADGPMLGLLSYLTMLFAIALGLAYARPERFHALRYAAIGGQGLLGLAALVSLGAGEWVMFFVFLSIWWVMLMGESLTAALQNRAAVGNVFAALLGTGGYVTLGGWTLAIGGPNVAEWLATFLIMVAVLNAAVALQFASGIDVLRARPRTAIDKLGVALCAAAGVLIVTAAAFQFDGYGMAVAWLALAIAAVELGRRLPSAGVSVFALIVLALALCRIVTIDLLGTSLRDEVWATQWLTITHWSLLALGTIAAVITAAIRLGAHRSEAWRGLPTILLVAAGLGWLGWCAMHANGEAITAGWLAGSVALLAVQRWLRRQHALEIGLVMLLVTAGRWLLIDAIADRLDPAWEAMQHTPLLNPQMALAVAIVAVGFWSVQLMRTRAAEVARNVERATFHGWMQFVCILAGVLFLIACSFEIDRAVMQRALGDVAWSAGHVRQVMLTMLWSIGGLGFGILAKALTPGGSRASSHAPWLISAAWLILGLTGLKWLLVDTLFWAFALDRAQTVSFVPLVNVQLLAGLLIVGGALLLFHLRLVPDQTEVKARAGGWQTLGTWMPVLASVLLLWGLTFEVDRWLTQRIETGAVIAWPFEQWRILWWIGLWTLGGLVMNQLGLRRDQRALLITGITITSLATLAWLTIGTLFWRLGEEAAQVPLFGNVQFLTGALAIMAIAMMLFRARSLAQVSDSQRSTILPWLATLLALALLWLGTFEIDRAFIEHEMARQMGWSVYWALFGVALVLAGFRFRAGSARYAGLALLAITVGKILVVDLATVAEIWRVLSLIVTGLLLIGTSAAYVKFAPRLLDRAQGNDAGKSEVTPTM